METISVNSLNKISEIKDIFKLRMIYVSFPSINGEPLPDDSTLAGYQDGKAVSETITISDYTQISEIERWFFDKFSVKAEIINIDGSHADKSSYYQAYKTLQMPKEDEEIVKLREKEKYAFSLNDLLSLADEVFQSTKDAVWTRAIYQKALEKIYFSADYEKLLEANAGTINDNDLTIACIKKAEEKAKYESEKEKLAEIILKYTGDKNWACKLNPKLASTAPLPISEIASVNKTSEISISNDEIKASEVKISPVPTLTEENKEISAETISLPEKPEQMTEIKPETIVNNFSESTQSAINIELNSDNKDIIKETAIKSSYNNESSYDNKSSYNNESSYDSKSYYDNKSDYAEENFPVDSVEDIPLDENTILITDEEEKELYRKFREREQNSTDLQSLKDLAVDIMQDLADEKFARKVVQKAIDKVISSEDLKNLVKVIYVLFGDKEWATQVYKKNYSLLTVQDYQNFEKFIRTEVGDDQWAEQVKQHSYKGTIEGVINTNFSQKSEQQYKYTDKKAPQNYQDFIQSRKALKKDKKSNIGCIIAIVVAIIFLFRVCSAL